ncbi:non-hydrolyzing UDP-N-acetylglucosamine 2-epimerase, partial [Paeniglutamicibacter sp. ORCA_105]|uniref:non-hydrolyzing UDP-N-acetylglucosamine 2-epimerase n=1 Tax=Paeniglutamicibacter sp. ORCA_105 TaxID=3377336 RepID=UPI0038934D41
IASLHLAPTTLSQLNLVNETIDPRTITVTGNTVIDALFKVVEKNIPFSDPVLEALVASGRKIVLVTTHRRENQGEPMRGIGRALARLSAAEPEVEFILPLHRNPAVREALLPEIEGRRNITLTEPLAYGEFTRLIAAANIVLTDSGGVQEEAPSLAKPVLVMRENTERPEAVVAGTVRLIGTDEEKIFESVELLLNDAAAYKQMALATNPYGDGKAAIRTVAAIAELLGVGTRMEDFDSNLPSEASLVNAASI